MHASPATAPRANPARELPLASLQQTLHRAEKSNDQHLAQHLRQHLAWLKARGQHGL